MAGVKTTLTKPVDVPTKSSFGQRIRRRLGWSILVIVVPLLALVIMVGVALQVIGVPVWGTAVKWVTASVHGAPSSSVVQTLQQQLVAEQTKAKSLQLAKAALQQQLVNEQQKAQSLVAELALANEKLKQGASALAIASQEAAVVKTMDPQAAATLLAKMTVAQAAGVIAALSPSDSGPVLSAMDPLKASQILAGAAQLSQANLNHSGTSAGTGASSAGLVGNTTG